MVRMKRFDDGWCSRKCEAVSIWGRWVGDDEFDDMGKVASVNNMRGGGGGAEDDVGGCCFGIMRT